MVRQPTMVPSSIAFVAGCEPAGVSLRLTMGTRRRVAGLWLLRLPPVSDAATAFHVGDAGLRVGRDDRIADAGERRPQPFSLFFGQDIGASCDEEISLAQVEYDADQPQPR